MYTRVKNIYSAYWQYQIPGSRYGPTGYKCHIKNEFVTEANQDKRPFM